MATTLSACATLLARAGIRHHLDAEQQALRAVFVTRDYENPRGEKLAIVQIETPDDGARCRAMIARAFRAADDPAAACFAACRLAADTPLVGVECDADGTALRLVVETVVEDGRLTERQLLAMLDSVVVAAETWHAGLRAAAGRGRPPRPRAKRTAA